MLLITSLLAAAILYVFHRRRHRLQEAVSPRKAALEKDSEKG